MIPSVPIPNRGEALRASWARQIAGAVNSLSALANNGGAKWTNLRDRRGGGAAVLSVDQGCYIWVNDHFENRYISINGELVEGPDYTTMNEGRLIVALRIADDESDSETHVEIIEYASWDRLESDRQDGTCSVFPLYIFEGAKPIVDLRSLKIYAASTDLKLYKSVCYSEETHELYAIPIILKIRNGLIEEIVGSEEDLEAEIITTAVEESAY